MNAKQRTVGAVRRLAVGAALLLAVTFTAGAQVQTQTTVAPAGPATKSVTVERGTIVYVSGNNVVVKRDDGEMLHFNNVPDSTTVTVNGQQLNVHQLQPGMVVERQTITTTTPRVITTVKTVTGTVFMIKPPNWVILRLDDGSNQQFKIPMGQKFNVGGQEVDAFGLRKGNVISAQQVTEEPETVIAREVKRTGTMPPPPPAPDPAVPILVVMMVPAPAPAATPAPAVAEAAPTSLPKTGSDFPLIGLLGALSMALGLGLIVVRTRRA
jgi:LPXTG-motif cell wall-anchored protein